MKLEKMMWIRTDKGVKQILDIEMWGEKKLYITNNYDVENGSIRSGFFEEDIIKASHNIVDVLKCGDEIEDADGRRLVVGNNITISGNTMTFDDYNGMFNFRNGKKVRLCVVISDILRITTKEQYEAHSTKVRE